MPGFSKVGIVGAGVIGASLLRAIKKYKPSMKTLAIDTDPDHRDYLLQNCLADRVGDKPDDLLGAELIVFCTPPGITGSLILRFANQYENSPIFIEVASVKGRLEKHVISKLAPDFPLIPAHPMTGSEASGPTNSDADLFLGRPCILCPAPGVPPPAIILASRFWRAFGAHVHLTSIDRHDAMVAVTSHLPHLVAFALSRAIDSRIGNDPHRAAFIGTGLHSSLRIAKAQPDLWTEILSMNSECVLKALNAMQLELEVFRKLLSADDTHGLREAIGSAVTSALSILQKYNENSDVADLRERKWT